MSLSMHIRTAQILHRLAQSLAFCLILLLCIYAIGFVKVGTSCAQELENSPQLLFADTGGSSPGLGGKAANYLPKRRDEQVLEAQVDVIDPDKLAKEKRLASIETRPFSKAKRGELSLGLGVMASDLFVIYMPLNLKAAYHFDNHWALEATASFMGCFSSQTGPNQERAGGQHCLRFLSPTYHQVMDKGSDAAGIRQLVIQEYQVARFGLNPIWSPIVGKFAFANAGIIHFDLHISAGLGVVILEVLDAKRIGTYDLKTSFEGNLGLGARFYLLNFLGIRFDFRQYFFGKQSQKGLATASEFSLGLSFLL